MCRSQLRSDQERLQKQLADAEHRSTEHSAKLEQERMGKEDSVRMRSLPYSGLQPQSADSQAAALHVVGAACSPTQPAACR